MLRSKVTGLTSLLALASLAASATVPDLPFHVAGEHDSAYRVACYVISYLPQSWQYLCGDYRYDPTGSPSTGYSLLETSVEVQQDETGYNQTVRFQYVDNTDWQSKYDKVASGGCTFLIQESKLEKAKESIIPYNCTEGIAAGHLQNGTLRGETGFHIHLSPDWFNTTEYFIGWSNLWKNTSHFNCSATEPPFVCYYRPPKDHGATFLQLRGPGMETNEPAQ